MQLLGFYLLKHRASVTFTSALHQTPERFGFISGLRRIDPSEQRRIGNVELPAAGGALARYEEF